MYIWSSFCFTNYHWIFIIYPPLCKDIITLGRPSTCRSYVYAEDSMLGNFRTLCYQSTYIYSCNAYFM